MKVSYFETGRYVSPPYLPREWPVPPANYDPTVGAEALRGMVERVKFVEALGFDWISLSEHHYSPRILTPSPVVSATWLAARVDTIKIALLGPIVPVSNPIRVAEELAMLDTLAPGRIVVGLLRGTTNEYLSYDLNPQEARERTDEGMELILKAWTEPQPFGWQGRHFQYRTVSIWPRPQDPPPPTYALGTSAEAGEFAARHHIGLGVSYGTFEVMAQATGHYRQRCAHYGWQPGTGRHHLPRQHDPGRNRRCGRRRAAPARHTGGVPGAAGAARCVAGRGHRAQRRRQAASPAGRRRAPDQLLRRPRPGGGADPPVSGAGRRRCARPVADRIPAPATPGRCCRRSICSPARSCRASGRSDRGVQRRLRRGGRLPYPLSGGGRGDAAGASARRRRHAPDARA